MLTALLFTAALAATPPPATPLGDAVTACAGTAEELEVISPEVVYTDGGLGVILPPTSFLLPIDCVLAYLGLPEWTQYRFDGWIQVHDEFTLTWVDDGLMILHDEIAPEAIG